VTAVNTAIDGVEHSRFFFISPWGVRFTTASKHCLSPAYGRASAWLKVVFALPTPVFHPEKKLEEVRDRIPESATPTEKTVEKGRFLAISQEVCLYNNVLPRADSGFFGRFIRVTQGTVASRASLACTSP
jgi:hypothetical protein